MKYLPLTFGIMRRRWLFTLIIVIETAALLILTNTMIATVISKNMLYEPYRAILEKNGVVVDASNLNMMECSNEDIAPFLEKYPDTKSVINFLEKKLDVKVHYSEQLSFVKQIGPRSVMYMDKGNTLFYYLLDKEILSELKFPLSCGRYPSEDRNGNGEIEIIISGGTDAELNSVYDTPAGKMRVVGILTDNTYKPVGNTVDRDGMEQGGDRDSIFNYCLPFDSQTNLGGPFAIAAKGVFPEDNNGYNIIPNSIWFVTYKDNISEAESERITEYLSTVGTIQKNQTLSTMKEETEKQINDIYYRMMPIIITAVIIVLSGLIGSAAVSTLRQVRTFGIFFLCGCRKKDCIIIVCIEMMITLLISALLALAGIIAMQHYGFEYLIGLTFGWMNVFISAILLLVLFVLSLILPFGIIRASSPVKTIKEA